MTRARHCVVLAPTFLTLALLLSCRPHLAPRSHTAIYGGTPVAEGKMLSTVSITFHEGPIHGHYCTGVLVTPRLVITAAHCVSGPFRRAHDDPETMRKATRVYVGNGADGGAFQGEYPIATWGTDPSYQKSIEGKGDLGFYTLATPITNVTPSPILTDSAEIIERLSPGKTVRLVGFGLRKDGVSGLKHEVDAPFMGRDSREILIGDKGVGGCNGDSGGPAFVAAKDGTWKLAGVTSHGSPGMNDPCGEKAYWSLVAPSLCWLQSATGETITNEWTCPAATSPTAALPHPTFQALCADETIPAETRRTVSAMLATLNAPDCASAASRVASVTDLAIDNAWISDTRPLTYARSLVKLSLRGNTITSIRPLSVLSALRVVDITINRVDDIEGIRALESRGVRVLGQRAQEGTFTDTPFLRICSSGYTASPAYDTMKAIFKITRGSDCQTVNFRAIFMSEMRLDVFKIKDLTPLAGFFRLRSLDLAGNEIADVTPLAALEELRSLNLERNQITNVAPLAALPRIESLNLWRNQVTSVAPLARATTLRSLEISGNPVKDVDTLAPLMANGLKVTGAPGPATP